MLNKNISIVIIYKFNYIQILYLIILFVIEKKAKK